MQFAELAGKDKVVGVKQTLRALEKGQVKKVFIARDAQKELVSPLVIACEEMQVCIEWAENMRLLGESCGVAVKTAAAGVLNPLSSF